MSATLILIAAISADGYLSRDRGVPWDLPADRAHFRAATRDRWLLLGRRTYEEMIGWFQPGHHPLILSRHAALPGMAGQRVSSVSEALQRARHQPELLCCGGAQVYAAAMPLAQRLIITHVHDRLGTGLAFPPISPDIWEPVSRASHAADHEHAFSFEIVTYQRHQRLDLAA